MLPQFGAQRFLGRRRAGFVVELIEEMVAGASQGAPSSPLEILTFERERCVFLAYKNIMISVWMGQANLAAAQAVERAARIMGTRYRAGRSYLAVILDGVPGPAPEATELLARVMGQREGLACIAYLLEGSGFWAGALRGVIGNVYRESGAAGRLKIGSSAEEIASWLSVKHREATGVAVSEEELCELLRKARAIGAR